MRSRVRAVTRRRQLQRMPQTGHFEYVLLFPISVPQPRQTYAAILRTLSRYLAISASLPRSN